MNREEKMKIVINNYFKKECSVNTSIREAFEKGFRIGTSKVQKERGKWIKKTKTVELNGAVAYDPVWICPKCGTSYDGCFAFNFVKYCYCCGIDLRTEEDT